MSSFELKLVGDVLYTGFGVDAKNDQIVKDVKIKLETIDFPGGPLLGINGHCSMPAAYAIADYVGVLCDAIAVFDPKLEPFPINVGKYVVVKSGTSTYQIGECVDLPTQESPQPMKVVLCGPPHTGKSCLREGLKQAMLTRYRERTSPYPYILTACPDGEGSWFSGTAAKSPELADELKKKYKADFTPEFSQKMSSWLSAIQLPLTIVDIGGRITDDNRLIMKPATHAVILWRRDKPEQLQEWLEFCKDLGLSVLAILESDYHGKEDSVSEHEPILKGSVHYLERGEDCSTRPAIQALSALLIQSCVW
jgi:CRISPR-associated protein Csx3